MPALGCQCTSPAPTSSWIENRSSSRPSRRWSRLSASSMRFEVRVQLGLATRTRCRRCAGASRSVSLPSQYAPATWVSLNAPIFAGALQRAGRGTDRGTVRSGSSCTFAPSGIRDRKLELVLLPAASNCSRASSRVISRRSNGWFVGDDLAHARLDALEVLGRERLLGARSRSRSRCSVGGPPATFTSGNSSVTAVASTCAAECRRR